MGPDGAQDLPFFCHYPLDRKTEWRRDKAKLSQLLADSSTCLLPLFGDKVLVHRKSPDSQLLPYIVKPGAEVATKHAATPHVHIFLGLDAVGAAYFGCVIKDPQQLLEELSASNTEGTTLEWMSGRMAGQELQQEDAALLATASGLAQWHSKERFHPVTGSPTEVSAGGYSRVGTGPEGGSSLYPRVDPAVIMLITSGSSSNSSGNHPDGRTPPSPASPAGSGAIVDDDWCLLGRKAAWPAGRFSTLAGFLEVGEPLEMAVAREVEEESGVVVDLPSVTYNSSQPWPFPKSLMLAFRGRAAPLNQQQHNSPGSSRNSSSGSSGAAGVQQGLQGYELLSTEARRAAMDVGLTPREVNTALLPVLPTVRVAKDELEDCRWFHREWMLAALSQQLATEQQQLQQQGHVTGQSGLPVKAFEGLAMGPAMRGEPAFNVPGPWSLANRLIKSWLSEHHHEPWAGDDIPQVAIDEGVFKYVLLRLREPDDQGRSKLLVWGDRRAPYHMDIFSQVKALAARRSLALDALGGGRIEHYPAKLYPHQQMYKWLAYGNDTKHLRADPSLFQKREFCFTMDGDIFVRYQSFKDGNDLAEAIVRKCPSKIDIGPVYTWNPQERQKYMTANPPFAPRERELVFDIDLTDYDDVRTCGKEGHICNDCWPLMAVAIKVIDRGLREDFGFENILWVYSGRRGVHCWEILPKQQLLEHEEMRTNILKYLPEDSLVQTVERNWSKADAISARTGKNINLVRWQQLQEAVEDRLEEVKGVKGAAKDFKALRALERCTTEIIFVHTYPRLDIEVSKKMNHLLKAPFCVHPKTGKVCVPLDPEQAHLFDPDTVPCVQTLLPQVSQQQLCEPRKIEEGWKATDLAPCIELFERKFLSGCQRSNRSQLGMLSREAANQALNSSSTF
ncbi:hypothetical protein DUNSADRAFT_17335 [Dunaliella salina]|uniref:DNA primase n=1 Tax=Dunaliella salina TaxID=3046 RepID=A0ABQ7G1W1_DUNSA|nr:hypothetical protein DUNSADRAFT_17335 [Dunaliella salina]|eukprot:KAF5828599.1 hypothetical protein DUNSADRAFT_17335 [Dunaliella salina]